MRLESNLNYHKKHCCKYFTDYGFFFITQFFSSQFRNLLLQLAQSLELESPTHIGISNHSLKAQNAVVFVDFNNLLVYFSEGKSIHDTA